MIVSIACVQFVFLALGMLALNVLLKAGGYAPNIANSFSPQALFLAHQGLWLFCIPLLWIAFATACLHWKNFLLNETTARVTGTLAAAAIFVAYLHTASLFF